MGSYYETNSTQNVPATEVAREHACRNNVSDSCATCPYDRAAIKADQMGKKL